MSVLTGGSILGLLGALNGGGGSSGGIQNNFDAVVDPAVTDNEAAGYSIGSSWINTITRKQFTLVGFEGTDAVWQQTGSGSESGEDGVFYIDGGNATSEYEGIPIIDGGAAE